MKKIPLENSVVPGDAIAICREEGHKWDLGEYCCSRCSMPFISVAQGMTATQVNKEISDRDHTGHTPHRCPVCMGLGQVPMGFYSLMHDGMTSTVTTPETCRTCGGRGIIWG